MSANLKCYDAASGIVTFDLQSHTTRLLGLISGDSLSGSIPITTGGATPFWSLASGGAWVYGQSSASGYFLISKDTTDNIKITITNELITYIKPKGVVIIYGVYV